MAISTVTGDTALIIGSLDDSHVSVVAGRLTERGRTRPVVIDVAALQAGRFRLTPDHVEVDALGRGQEVGVVALRPHSRAWLRRSAPPSWERGTVIGSHEAVVMASWLALVNAVGAAAQVEWLSDPTTTAAAENKVRQYAAAARIGIPIPRTIVASDRDEVTDFLGSEFIVKPFGPAEFNTGNGPYVLLTEAVDDGGKVDREVWAATPILAQEKLSAKQHLRVVTIGGRAWVGTLDVDADQPLDWRRDPRAHTEFRSTEDAGEVASRAVALSQEVGVGFSSQDWLVNQEGQAHFLDLNPGGQWLFLPFAASVAETLAAWLEGEVN